jgi:hypothetical protein
MKVHEKCRKAHCAQGLSPALEGAFVGLLVLFLYHWGSDQIATQLAIWKLRTAATFGRFGDAVAGEFYVPRPEVEDKIRKYLDAQIEMVRCYLIVGGARGVGKATAVRNALAKRKGVMWVSLSPVSPTTSFEGEIGAITGLTLPTIAAVGDILRTAKQQHPGYKPVIVVEIGEAQLLAHEGHARDKLVDELLQQLGTRLSTLCLLASEVSTPDQAAAHVQDEYDRACRGVEDCRQLNPTVNGDLLKRLVEGLRPAPVSTEITQNLSQDSPLVYNFVSHSLAFSTPADFRAAQALLQGSRTCAEPRFKSV